MTTGRMGSVAILSSGILLLVVLVSFFLLHRNRYYDYAPATCSTSGYLVTARLAGDWTKSGRTQDKGSPYTLVIETSLEAVVVDSIEVASRDSEVRIPVKIVYVRDPGLKGTGFVSEPLDLPYVDVTVSGRIRAENTDSPQRFRCELRTNYHQEIRVTFMDNLMSV